MVDFSGDSFSDIIFIEYLDVIFKRERSCLAFYVCLKNWHMAILHYGIPNMKVSTKFKEILSVMP
jgi:hypothetical protein